MLTELLAQARHLKNRRVLAVSHRRRPPAARAARTRAHRESPLDSPTMSGRRARQTARECGHRGANAHSARGASNADSGWPGIARSRPALCAISGRAAASAAV
jgi:hypothetical protein